jgi:hypothetical protein
VSGFFSSTFMTLDSIDFTVSVNIMAKLGVSKVSKPDSKSKALSATAKVKDNVTNALRLIGKPSNHVGISNCLKRELGYDNIKGIKRAIQMSIKSGTLVTVGPTGSKYWITGEEYVEEQQPQVGITEIKMGETGPSGTEGVRHGDVVAINYCVSLKETGAKVESGKKFSFEVGAGDVIKGMRGSRACFWAESGSWMCHGQWVTVRGGQNRTFHPWRILFSPLNW